MDEAHRPAESQFIQFIQFIQAMESAQPTGAPTCSLNSCSIISLITVSLVKVACACRMVLRQSPATRWWHTTVRHESWW